ncbi:hypothetical protein [uncultured Microbulbifer sp.]|uniref:hypothetical protein n=1 Tax=uncultured Microbulbifer sp. TaxID=348147 RepID=UPI0026041111|nr:hypothetical protein [uncultured Microbulbifer sp.]
MSWMTKKEIVRRLESASEASPLAVFHNNPEGKRYEGLYDVGFANTVVAQQRIGKGLNVVGVFHGPHQFNRELERAGLNGTG